MAGDVVIQTVPFVCVASGTQDVTLAGLGAASNIKGAIIQLGTPTALITPGSMSHTVGFLANTDQRTHATCSVDGVGTSDVKRVNRRDEVINWLDLSGTETRRATAVFITDGLRLTWTVSDSIAHIGWVTFFAGADVQCAVGDVGPGATATVGFRSQFIYAASCRTGYGSISNFGALSVGIALDPGGSGDALQSSINYYATDALGTAQTRIYNSTGNILSNVAANSVTGSSRVTNITATSFDLAQSGSGRAIGYLAVATDRQIGRLAEQTIPASTGVQSYTFGFRPQAVFSLCTFDNVRDQFNRPNQSSGGWGVVTVNAERLQMWHDESGTGTMNTGTIAKDAVVGCTAGNGTGEYRAKVDAATATGIDLDWEDVGEDTTLLFDLYAIEEGVSGPTPIVRIVNESAQVSEALLELRKRVDVLTDTANVSEALLPLRKIVQVIGEAAQVAESTIEIRRILRVTDEVAQVAEGLLESRRILRVTDEAVQVSEGTIPSLSITRVVDETAQIADAQIPSLSLTRIVNETAQVSEATLELRTLTAVLNEFMTATESLVSLRDLVRVVSEGAQIAESTIIDLNTGIVQVVNEGLQIAESTIVDLNPQLTRIVNEGLQVTEGTLEARVITRIQSEFLVAQETLVEVRTLLRQIDEAAQISEAVAPSPSFSRVVNEAIQVAEGIVIDVFEATDICVHVPIRGAYATLVATPGAYATNVPIRGAGPTSCT